MGHLPDGKPRCRWASDNALLAHYHDSEWGVPVFDSRALWEKLILDGFQAGLSWLTILKKRDAFREAFEGFEPARIARYDEHDVARLMNDASIVRSRRKIEASVDNARAYLSMEARGEPFGPFCWQQVGGSPLEGGEPIPTQTPLSKDFSQALKERGFRFVGPVIVYAWMQATGMVNDHQHDCFRRDAVRDLK